MIITAWILAVVFGLVTLLFLRKVVFGSLNVLEIFFFIFSAIVSAVSIGLIYSGSWTAFIS